MKIVPHRSTHACFPAIPFDFPDIENFSYYTGINPTYWRNQSKYHRNDDGQLDELDYYAKWCHSDAVRRANATARSIAHSLGIDLTKASGKAFRRLIENPVAAITSFENLGRAFTLPSGSSAKMIAVTCAFTRLNAIVWLVCILVVFCGFYLTCCWPCFNLASIFIYFICCCGLLRAGNRKRVARRARIGSASAASVASDADSPAPDDEIMVRNAGGDKGEEEGEGGGGDDDGGGKEAPKGASMGRKTMGSHRRASRHVSGRYPGLPREHSLAELWSEAEPGGGAGIATPTSTTRRGRIGPEGTLYGAPLHGEMDSSRV